METRPSIRSQRFLTLLAALAVGLAPAGCGGGGGRGRPAGDIAGVVTDVDGSSVPGARVAVGSNATTSLSNGTFMLFNVADGFQTVVAQADINGRRWSAETRVDVAGGTNNRNLNLVVSDERFQGEISGSVVDGSNFALPGAKVFIQGPSASTLAVTDNNGNYKARRITPGVTYKVTCSLAGFVNDSRDVHVAVSATSDASFRLVSGSSQGAIPAPQNVRAQSWTVADTVTRASPQTLSIYDAIKRYYRRKAGLPDVAQAKNVQRKRVTRSTPQGSVIEVDLFWDAQNFGDLFGYLIRRGTSAGSLADEAVARDPLAHAFFDADFALTPDVSYFYAVHALDTIDFPARGAVGPASATISATPFGPMSALSPAQAQVTPPDPLFQWTPVSGAASYTIFLWNRFPDLLSNTDPNGVTSIWQGGNSVAPAPRTSQRYDGPALLSGHTYYWMVVASDANAQTFSVTEIAKFTPR